MSVSTNPSSTFTGEGHESFYRVEGNRVICLRGGVVDGFLPSQEEHYAEERRDRESAAGDERLGEPFDLDRHFETTYLVPDVPDIPVDTRVDKSVRTLAHSLFGTGDCGDHLCTGECHGIPRRVLALTTTPQGHPMDLYSQFELNKMGYHTQAPRPDIGIIGPQGAVATTTYLTRRSPPTTDPGSRCGQKRQPPPLRRVAGYGQVTPGRPLPSVPWRRGVKSVHPENRLSRQGRGEYGG